MPTYDPGMAMADQLIACQQRCTALENALRQLFNAIPGDLSVSVTHPLNAAILEATKQLAQRLP